MVRGWPLGNPLKFASPILLSSTVQLTEHDWALGLDQLTLWAYNGQGGGKAGAGRATAVSLASAHDIPVETLSSCGNHRQLPTLPSVPWEVKPPLKKPCLLGPSRIFQNFLEPSRVCQSLQGSRVLPDLPQTPTHYESSSHLAPLEQECHMHGDRLFRETGNEDSSFIRPRILRNPDLGTVDRTTLHCSVTANQ